MQIIKVLSEKPWLEESFNDGDVMPSYSSFRGKRFALNTFLMVVSVFFSLFIVTFLARSQYPDFIALGGEVWQPLYDTSRLWINTGFLLLSSIFLHLAFRNYRLENKQIALLFLLVAVLSAIQFLISQMSLWKYLSNLGFSITSNPANSYFYLLTGIHGLHLVGGIVVVFMALYNFYRVHITEKICDSLALCVRYWHYLFLLWLCIFFLMTSPPSTYKTLASLCGY